MQRFCNVYKSKWEVQNGMVVPDCDFNAVYLLSHIYRHLFGLGIGLRQLMDYYFMLRTRKDNKCEDKKLIGRLDELGLKKFAGATMWVLQEVFGMDDTCLICPPDEKRGKALLRDIIQSGNFGHYDKEQKAARKTLVGSIGWKLKRGVQMVKFYPSETLSEPVWKVAQLFIK